MQQLTSPYHGSATRLRLTGSTLLMTATADLQPDTLFMRAFGLDGKLHFAQAFTPAPNRDVGGDLHVPEAGSPQLVMIAKELHIWPLPAVR